MESDGVASPRSILEIKLGATEEQVGAVVDHDFAAERACLLDEVMA